MKLTPGFPLPMRRPVLAGVLPFLAGIAAADAADIGPVAAAWGAAGALACAWAGLRNRAMARAPRCPTVLCAAAAAAFFLLGTLRWSLRTDLPPDHIAVLLPPGAEAELDATVEGEPRHPWPHPLAEASAGNPGRSSFVISVDSLTAPAPRPASGLVLVSSYARLPPLRPGDRIRVRGALRSPRPPGNPGQEDPRVRLARQGIHRTLALADPARLVVGAPAPRFSPPAALAALRRRLCAALGAGLRPGTAAYLGALVFGADDPIPAEAASAFRRTGTIHYLAISGFHLMLLWGALLAGLRRVRWDGRAGRAAGLAIIATYTALTGLQAPVVRAFLMILALQGADPVRRRADALSSLSVAALAIAAVDPAQAFDPGFQLSFLSVAGIVWIHPILRAFASAPADPLDRLLPPSRAVRLARRAARYARDGTCVSLAAWLATAPVVAARFHLMTPVINAANLVLCPLVTAQLVGGAVKAATGLAGGPLDAVAAFLIEGLQDAAVAAAAIFADLPGAWFPVPRVSLPVVAVYAGLLAIAVRLGAAPRPRRCVLAVVPLVTLLGAAPAGPDPPPGFRVVALDVGHGSALVCESPEGGVLVYDAGSSRHGDAGRAVVAPYLRSRGVTAIDLLVLSHADADHTNGAPTLLDQFRVGAVALSPRHAQDPAGGRLISLARDAGVRVLRPAAGDRLDRVPGLTVEVLAPRDPPPRRRTNDNDASLVVRVTASDGSAALFTGDLESRGLAALLGSGEDRLHADVLAIPHHGSRGSRSPALARAVRAGFALASAEERFASRETLDDYEAAGAAVLRTWSAGAIAVERVATGWRVRTHAGGWR